MLAHRYLCDARFIRIYGVPHFKGMVAETIFCNPIDIDILDHSSW